MINLLPEPKIIRDLQAFTQPFSGLAVDGADEEFLHILSLRLRRCEPLRVYGAVENQSGGFKVQVRHGLTGIACDQPELLREQGYTLNIHGEGAVLHYETKQGFVNGVSSLKRLLVKTGDEYKLPACEIMDWPSIRVRAVAPTFSWYAGYGRIGFDCQLWGFDEWLTYIDICLDNKINQLNLLMYGYWPFELDEYPETVLRNVPIKIWNAENRRWLGMRYTHPNLEQPYLEELITYAHNMGMKVFAYVGLNSYNGGYSIKHPEARTKPPKSSKFLNDFDSLCLSHPGTVDYILRSMARIAELGFDGYSMEESEEGFWYCECDECKRRWHHGVSPGEAKHRANIWLLNQIYNTVRAVNPEAVIGIRAFRQPPLEKDPAFLKECADTMPKDVVLFWAPGLYVPEGEFDKWIAAFGPERIWARDTESNAITSTMGRLYRVFKSNILRYEDEPNEQVIETDIRQHIGSVARGVHGINGFMFEWYGLFLHLFAHGNYGWGSTMDPEAFYLKACEAVFGDYGTKVLYILKNMLTIHESQMNLYTTPFPFQKNRLLEKDIPAIRFAQQQHPYLLSLIEEMQGVCAGTSHLREWLPHFDKLRNAQRRNAVIYDMALVSLAYDAERDPVKKDALLNEILALNEKDFDIAKEMFFDINPVTETGVRSCMFPYHEIKRLIHNIRHPEAPDGDIICSGIEALGWLWL